MSPESGTQLLASSQPETDTTPSDVVARDRRLAWQDAREGMTRWPVWLLLAWQDIRLRYRRSVLGPFWITLSMAITVFTMGYLYSHLFHASIQTYFPYLAAGMLVWALLSSMITELTETYIGSESLMKQVKLPYSLYIHRTVTRNFLIFFHNLLIMIPILLFFHPGAQLTWSSLLLFPALFLLYINAVLYGIILGMLGARFRDVSQVIRSLVNIIFFVTPVMWLPDVLPDSKRIFVWLNPAAAFLDMVRAPMLGQAPALHSVGYVLLMTVIGGTLCYKMFTRYRARIVYWV